MIKIDNTGRHDLGPAASDPVAVLAAMEHNKNEKLFKDKLKKSKKVSKDPIEELLDAIEDFESEDDL